MDTPMSRYSPDLAFIHDTGHGDCARHAAAMVLDLLRVRGTSSGLIVDVGCGSGIAAEIWGRAGYEVLGIDLSPAMIDLARRRAPRAEFRVGSFLDADIPPCAAVTAIGECFSFLFDGARGVTPGPAVSPCPRRPRAGRAVHVRRCDTRPRSG
jgi:SAM-dependent methyltransferase